MYIFVCQNKHRSEADLTVALEKWTKKGLQVHIQLSQPQFHSTIHPRTHSRTHTYTHTHSYTHKYRRKRLPPPPPSSHDAHVYTIQVNMRIHSHTCEWVHPFSPQTVFVVCPDTNSHVHTLHCTRERKGAGKWNRDIMHTQISTDRIYRLKPQIEAIILIHGRHGPKPLIEPTYPSTGLNYWVNALI